MNYRCPCVRAVPNSPPASFCVSTQKLWVKGRTPNFNFFCGTCLVAHPHDPHSCPRCAQQGAEPWACLRAVFWAVNPSWCGPRWCGVSKAAGVSPGSGTEVLRD